LLSNTACFSAPQDFINSLDIINMIIKPIQYLDHRGNMSEAVCSHAVLHGAMHWSMSKAICTVMLSRTATRAVHSR